MKKLKLLPSMLMLIVCVAVLCVGVFSLTPTENTIGGTINISSMARVKLTCYVDEEVVYDSQNTAYGVDWDLTETALNFDVSSYADAEEVPLRTIRIHIQNLTGLHLGVYFYNGDETTLQTINGEKYATYDSLQLSDAVYKANAEEIDENKLVDIALSPYGYIAPANADNTYDEYDMFINFDVVNLDIMEVSKVISYMLRIEEYQSNVTINSSNVATFTPLEGKTKQLVKLPTNNSNTTVPTLADASYGNVVIPTSYTSIPASGLTACTGVISIAIPQSITNVGKSAMKGCSSLKQIDWHAKTVSNFSLSSANGAFPATYTILNITSSVGTLPDFMNMDCTALKNVHMSNGVTRVDSRAFSGCSSITNLSLPGSVTSIDSHAFRNCGLISMAIPDGVITIGSNAFEGCGGLTSITIPDSVITIGTKAFEGCDGLTSVKYSTSGGAETTGTYTFEDGELTINSMPSSVDTTPSWYSANINPLVLTVAFNCEPPHINASSFAGCCNLTGMITIPNSVKSMGFVVFKNCHELVSVFIPSTVITMAPTEEGDSLFFGCSPTLEINTDVASEDAIPSGWGQYWNYYSNSETLTVNYNQPNPNN